MENNSIFVGQIIPELQTNEPFVMMTYSTPVWQYTVGFPNITDEQVKEFQYGSFVACAATLNDVLFFFINIGKSDWMDASFEPRLYDRNEVYDLFLDGEGAPLLVNIVDTATGEVKALRMLGLGTELSNYMSGVCNRLLNSKEDFNADMYRQKVHSIYQKYVDTKELMKKSAPKNVFVLANQE